MGKPQADSVFVFDEPTIGLHPLDVQTLLNVFQTLISQGATVIVIEHDLDVIRNADYIIDMGPGGGLDGGQIVAAGTLEDIKKCSRAVPEAFCKIFYNDTGQIMILIDLDLSCFKQSGFLPPPVILLFFLPYSSL